MKKTVKISFDCNPAVLADAELTYVELGYTLEEALNLFLAKSIEVGGIPFDAEPDDRARQPR